MNAATDFLQQLQAALPGHGRVLIVTHDYPDPDALASAAALQLLIKQLWQLKGQIVFHGGVSRPENRELLRNYRYRTTATRKIAPSRRRLPAIFTDALPWGGNVTLPPGIRPVAVFDHHQHLRRRQPVPAGMLLDIQPDLGATTTRLHELLAAAQVTPPPWLATIMAYAIATETMEFTHGATERDIAAHTALLAECNPRLLGRIRNAPLPREYYAFLAEGMRQARTYRRVAWSHLTDTPQPEIVAEIADLLLRMERITWAFCTAGMGDRLIISIRSESDADCGRYLRKITRRQPGSFGGHSHAAAGYLDLTGMSPAQRIQCKDELVNDLVAGLAGQPGEEARRLVEDEHRTPNTEH